MTITLITGANKGIGHEAARQLVAAGHTVYAAARSAENARRTAEELGTLPIVIDVTDEDSIGIAAREIEREHGHLDVLINNAGVSSPPVPPAEVTAERFTAVFDTNVVGIVRMMHAFFPLLQKSGNGVVVNVGSGIGSFGLVHDPERLESKIRNLSYSTSKTAVSMLTVQYAKAYPELRINVVDPGPTATEINGFRGFQTVEQGAAILVRAATIGPDGPTGAFLHGDVIVPW